MTLISTEPIAIIGTGCRFPGAASSPSQLWELLRNPRDVASKPPTDRFNGEAFYKAGKACPGMTNAPKSYFLQEDVKAFDAPFFNISPAEAAAMDPQQRFLLEVVYEALERAGLPLENLQGSSTGVYSGFMNYDYNSLLTADTNSLPPFYIAGTDASMLATRISFFFDWNGPSLVVDTACSSSLTALHVAVEALRKKECSLAVVTGSCLILSPDASIASSQGQMLSQTGRSHMWDERADGYARGEGVAAIVLKPLSKALQDGDSIESVIRATGINCDGRTKSLTAPSGDAQRELIRSTYARAGLNPLRSEDRCQYFEAHGTGTPAGDPQEALGISGAFFGPDTKPEELMYAGSIKTVIGHTESAAGIAGVMKASLALKHGVIPPNLLFDKPSPQVSPHLAHLRVPAKPLPWPTLPTGAPRRASVNSFGLGGANAHAILESCFENDDKRSKAAKEHTLPIVLPFVFSAASPTSLRALLQNYVEFLEKNPTVDLMDLAFSSLTRRSVLGHRMFITADSVQTLQNKLRAESEARALGDTAPINSRRLRQEPKTIIGVFTGQGAQWPQMGLDLISQCPQAAIWLQELQESLNSLPVKFRPDFTLLDELCAPPELSRLDSAEISLTLRTALQIIQTKITWSLGISFATVIGHSSGEIAAAYAAGILTAAEAIRISYLRGRACKYAGSAGQAGSMLAVGISWDQAQAICSEPPYAGRIKVAASNSPSSVTLSGDEELITELEWLFESLNQSPRRLKVDTAYHSHHMLPCEQPYLQAMRACDMKESHREPKAKWFSSVNESSEPMATVDTTYWTKNMLQPVLFSQALGTAVKNTHNIDAIIEIGPHPALRGPCLQTLSTIASDYAEIPYFAFSNRKMSGIEAISHAIGTAWANLGSGILDIQRFIRLFSSFRSLQYLSNLPSYRFDHSQTYWSVPQTSMARIHRRRPRHSLLGVNCPDTGQGEWRWRNYLRLQDVEWADGHRLQGQTVLPATSYLVMALEAAHIIADGRSLQLVEIQDFLAERAIYVPDDSVGVETLFTVTQPVEKSAEMMVSFACHSAFNGTFLCCVSGRLKITFGEKNKMILPVRGPLAASTRPVNSEHFYMELGKLGFDYAGSFRALKDIARRRDVAYGKVPLPHVDQHWDLMIHPATLDVGLQTLLVAIGHPGDSQLSGICTPTRIDSIIINPILCESLTGELEVEASLNEIEDRGTFCGDIGISDTEGHGLVQIEGLRLKPLAPLSEEEWPMFAEEKWGPLLPTASLATTVGTEDLHSINPIANRLGLLYLRDAQNELTAEDRQQLDPHRAEYVAWMDRVLTRIREGSHPLYNKESLEGSTTSFLDSGFDSSCAEILALRTVGPKLVRWFRGEADLMEELRREDILTRLYQESHDFGTMSNNMAKLVGQLAFRYPRMKILEVGAGTGSATRLVLQHIGRDYHSYTYTDISAAFFEEAQQAFAAHQDRFQYDVLDLERDPTDQGFLEHQYDLVIASNVLHATRSLKQTMSHIRRLLKPGGRVAIFENTAPDFIFTSLIFGAFEGWWLGKSDGRAWGPLVSPEDWTQLLQTSGFDGMETITPLEESQMFGLSVFTARAQSEPMQNLQDPLSMPAHGQHRDLILLGGSTSSTQSILQEVRTMIGPFFARITHAPTIEDCILPPDASQVVVLVLADIDYPCLTDLTGDRLSRLQGVIEITARLLWVATGNVSQTPYLRMSKGLLRSLAHENPNAQLQHLTVQDAEALSPEIIASTLMSLVNTTASNDYRLANGLENIERELLLENGVMKIPRIRSIPTLNQRWLNSRGYTSSRQVIPRDTRLEYRVCNDDRQKSLSLSHVDDLVRAKSTWFECHYMTSLAVVVNGEYLHLAVGKDTKTKKQSVALTAEHASVLTDSPLWFSETPSAISEVNSAAFLEDICAALVAQQLIRFASKGSNIVVHEASKPIQRAVLAFASMKSIEVHFTTNHKETSGPDSIFFAPRCSSRKIASLLPRDVSVLAIFVPGDEHFAARMRSVFPPQTTCVGLETFYRASSTKAPECALDETSLVQAYRFAEQEQIVGRTAVEIISPGDLVDTVGMQIVNWRHSGPVSLDIVSASSLVELSAHKTYVLIGLAGDLGKSICQWMVTRGARFLVLTSRSPKADDDWLAEMLALGAHVAMMAM